MPALVEEIVKRPEDFTKLVLDGPLWELRQSGGQGLFVSSDGSPVWEKAHRILMHMKNYRVEVGEVINEVLSIWSSKTSRDPIDIGPWMTNLTFESICWCGFGYHPNCLAEGDKHPFLKSVQQSLEATNSVLGQSL